MFGQNTFGNTSFGGNNQQNKPAFGGFGSTTTSQPQSTFGGGGLFGQQTSTSTGGGGLFGTTTSSFGQTNTFGQPAANTSFGQTSNTSFGASSAFKPAGFGGTTTQSSGGLFGASSTTTQSGGLFGGNNQNNAFGGSAPAPFGQSAGATSAFGQQNNAFGGGSGFGAGQNQDGTGHTKFEPTTATDTMMKSGVQSQINTRHQCITCMKQYEHKSLEELRCEDYLANRKGGGAGGGMFGQTAAPAPAAGGGLFGSTTSSSGGLFGGQQQQQNKPLFGTSGFGQTTTSAAPTFGGFGQTSQAGGGGMFGNKPTGFGAPVASVAPAFGASNTGFGGATSQPSSGGLFGSSAPAFGSNTTGGFGANTTQSGGLFGSTTSQPSAFGTTNTTTGFGGGFGTQQQQQPNQNIGLFGANNQQNKPAFGGFGQPASTAATGFGATGGFGATTSQAGGGLFGANNQNKPAFGGFGAPATSQPAATSFGGFGQNTGGGLFGGNTQNKPAAFSFGSTAPAAAPTQSFGGFGTSNTGGGGLFGNNQAKPGGLFGSTNTFGAGTTGFGSTAPATGGFGGFGSNNSSFGGGLNFGGAATNTVPAAQPQPAASIHQQLLTLTSSPFGENPLFKPLASDANKRADILKPTNPAAQKAVLANSYKPSPHRNVKIRVKPNSSSDKSQIFEGLDDDLVTGGDMFVPRPSVKKLVLRNTVTDTSNMTLTGLETTDTTRDNIADNSLTVGLHENVAARNKSAPTDVENETIAVDDSFAALNTRKKLASEEDKEASPSKPVTSKKNGSAEVILQREGYYTIPAVSQLSLDADGQCLVTGFTVGREGYGNIHFPGTINIAFINLDDIVHIRHKEVIVYPDDDNKPPLGEGLNRPAQITLDKVWPVDKSNGDSIKSPDRLRKMSYEEKLERASSRLGAKFIEYRPETGSWVFKVDHFSKYGLLEDSDDEADMTPIENVKKVKTLEKRQETVNTTSLMTSQNQVMDNNAKNIMFSAVDNNSSVNTNTLISSANIDNHDDAEEGSDKDIEMNDSVAQVYDQQRSVARSALFDDEAGGVSGGSSKPVILQHRVSSIGTISVQPRIIECIANSVLGPVNRGLGGVSMMGANMSSSSYIDTSNTSLLPPDQSSINMSGVRGQQSRSTVSKLASYSLQGGYDKWVTLPGHNKRQGSSDQWTVFVSQHVDTELDLSHSYLGHNTGRPVILDMGLTMSKSSRAGWSKHWDLVSAGGGVGAVTPSKCFGNVSFSSLSQTSCGDMDHDQVESLRQWFNVALDNSARLDDVDGGGAMFVAVRSIDTLHNHQTEAAKQLNNLTEASLEWNNWVNMFSQVWSLMVALWGRVEEVTGEEEFETHDITMTRREAVSRWLETVVDPKAKRDLETAALNKNVVGGVVADLSGGDVSGACRRLQQSGDHRTALLAAQLGGGGEAGRLMRQQLERWTEVKTDKNINQDRLRLFTLIAGCPVWRGSSGAVNTCAQLEWVRGLAAHLWYLTHPLASLPDALHQFELAWRGKSDAGFYCAGPGPEYDACPELGQLPQHQDIRYLLLRLYCDRSTGLEELCDPSSNTSDRMDLRMGWFVLRVLEVLGYGHMSESGRERLHRDMASQAERSGLWVWSVFVLQHIQCPRRRSQSVKAVIDRNIMSCTDEEKDFLVSRLGVPLEWVAASKATLAKSRQDPRETVENLLLAKKWSEAHDVLVKEIAPDCIISQDYEYINGLLSQLAPPHVSDQIPGWSVEGSVYHQFISVEAAVSSVLQAADDHSLQYQLEKLRPAVARLCRSVSTIPVSTAKERLAQSEIAKKVAHLMRAVHTAVGTVNNNSARQLAELLSSLPLPEDYALQELRSLTRSYMMEIA